MRKLGRSNASGNDDGSDAGGDAVSERSQPAQLQRKATRGGLPSAADPAPAPSAAASWLAGGPRAATNDGPLVQRKHAAPTDGEVQDTAARGVAGRGSALPFLDRIQASFGRHDVSAVEAHVGGPAADASAAIGAEAYATGHHVAFAGPPDLHTAAHEAAHVVQQRAGVQLLGGVGQAGDRYEQHADAVADRVVRGQPSADLLDELAGGGAAAGGPKPVQRIIRVNGGQVAPPHHDELIARVQASFAAAQAVFTPAHLAALRGWLDDHDHVIAAASIDALARNLYAAPEDPTQWISMTSTAIPADAMKQAQAMRARDRAARVLEPSTTPLTSRVPGLGKLDDQQLLRLQDHGVPEEQFWMRPSESDDEQLDTVKRRGISDADEAHVTAAGKADDPSYVVALNNRHLGHRYVGSGRQTGTGNPRTYGSKNAREGYEYKGSGLVDGHAIQVQDDQEILGPYQEDAAAWSTSVKKTDGSSVSYPDHPYLPKDATDTRMIETHPHNFYWENQGQGQRMRQKAIEAPAMKAGHSFLHYNAFGGTTFNPNAGSAQDHLYDVASRIHYLHQTAGGGQTHYDVDNRPVADYSDPAGYDATTRQYPDIPSGVPQKGENASLGGTSAFDHLALARQPDTSQFPFATVLHPESPDFSFKPDFRTTLAGYESPPQSPYFAPEELVEEERAEPGNKKRKRHFYDAVHADALVTGADYDEAADQTSLTLTRRNIAEPSSWPAGGDDLAQAVASRAKKAKLAEATDAPVSSHDQALLAGGSPPVASTSAIEAGVATAPSQEVARHRERIAQLDATLAELEDALGAEHADLHAELGALHAHLAAIDRDDATQAAAVAATYAHAVHWFRANHRRLYRRHARRYHGEPGSDPLSVAGERIDALRQFFAECGQMAVHNVLALDGDLDDADDEHLLDGHGTYAQDQDEDSLREMLAAVGRPDLPVVANLAALDELLGHFHNLGPAAAEEFDVGLIEQAGHVAITQFRTNAIPALNLVVNTDAAAGGLGRHWIAVQLRRQPDGQIAVSYLDSYDAPLDHRQLFAGLRHFFGAIGPNPAGHGALAHGPPVASSSTGGPVVDDPPVTPSSTSS